MGQGLSRREFLYLSAAIPFSFPLSALAHEDKGGGPAIAYPNTVSILENAFEVEIVAHRHYVGFAEKALEEDYPNIAYLFHSFSYSEKIHSDNYQRILCSLGKEIKNVSPNIEIRDTRSNLQTAAKRELEKIEKTYPALLKELEKESCEEAIVSCMYSWKSHQQHKEKVNELLRYSGMFFGRLAKEIEGLKLDFHVCKVCGSTIDRPPDPHVSSATGPCRTTKGWPNR